MYELTRVCSQCRGEFRPEIETCPDCNITLGYRETSHATAPPRAPALPDEAPAEVLRIADLSYVKRLKERLLAAGISCRVEEDEQHGRYHVLIAECDYEAAVTVDGEVYREQVPDAGDCDLAADRCPACGASLAPQAPECRDCGLLFPEVDE